MDDELKIPIKKYVMDESASWEERYRQLDKHHFEETEWLMREIRRLKAPQKPRCTWTWRAGVLQTSDAPPEGARCLLEPHDESVPHKFPDEVEAPDIVRGQRLGIMYSAPQTIICTPDGRGIATVHGETREQREHIAKWMVDRCDRYGRR